MTHWKSEGQLKALNFEIIESILILATYMYFLWKC